MKRIILTIIPLIYYDIHYFLTYKLWYVEQLS